MRNKIILILVAAMVIASNSTLAQDTIAVNIELPDSLANTQYGLDTAALHREQQLVVLKDRIRLQHQRLTTQCSDEGLNDKNRVRFLKNIYYSYLSIYNSHNVNSIDGSQEYYDQMVKLDNFQVHLRDSILGADSYPSRIENFKNTLKLKSGKEHADVYRSYCRVFQPPTIAINFTTYEEYRQYVNQHKAIIEIQDLYLKTIPLLQQIDANSGSIVAMLGKNGQANNYKSIVATTDFVPAFTSKETGELFIKKLNDFIQIQQEYLKTDQTIRNLQHLADSVFTTGRKYSDLTAAFRMVQQSVNVYPSFRNLDELSDYERQMNDYECVTQQYIQLIHMRDTIAINESIINHSTKTLRDGHKCLKRFTQWTPDFNTPQAGEQFLEKIRSLIAMQNRCIAINDNIVTQGEYEKEILALTKNYTYIRRGYNTMLKSYNFKGAIATYESLDIYADLQQMIVSMQEALLTNIKKNPMELERMMRAEKTLTGLKAMINVR